MFQLLELQNVSIYEQLQLEEALLKGNDQNWCIINSGSPLAIVMGISGKPELFVNPYKYNDSPIPLIKRFSGGGTVVIDGNTLFVTWICNKNEIFLNTPQEVLGWSKSVYQPLFRNTAFDVRENDYVFGEKKFGGNALYLRKDRWLLHTSFLWDFKPENMDYLLLPPKMPNYRENRGHLEFLCTLKDRFESKNQFWNEFKNCINGQFKLIEKRAQDIEKIEFKEHNKTTQLFSDQIFANFSLQEI
jgi:lipoate---protein ligase